MQDKGGADTIRIIVSYNPDLLIFPDFSFQDFHRALHAQKQPGIIHFLHGPLQVFPDIVFLHNIPVSDNPGEYRTDAEGFTNFLKVRSLCGYEPFCHINILRYNPERQNHSKNPPRTIQFLLHLWV